ncbi:MAG: hypothetical protein H7Y89_02435 [Steroidobacteraceae bacterium]|nr:hypothetical protein [Steroidobacteraceae bacterium]
MELSKHPGFRLQALRIGLEQAPLVVIDDFAAAPDALADFAAGKVFSDVASYYPGVRAKAPLSYQQFVIDVLRPVVADHFGLNAGGLRFTACYFSLVTTPPANLTYLQRIPHVDSLAPNELAFVHYLFRANHGGTAFFRHRATGFESVDAARKPEYWRHIETEQNSPDSPSAAYIDGDTALYEQTARQDGVFNRLLLYRRNSLHSAALPAHFVPDPNPRRGRLSLNGFLAA